ncbi:hypothetical protein ACP4OV_007649 [Aristida adscensionis]
MSPGRRRRRRPAPLPPPPRSRPSSRRSAPASCSSRLAQLQAPRAAARDQDLHQDRRRRRPCPRVARAGGCAQGEVRRPRGARRGREPQARGGGAPPAEGLQELPHAPPARRLRRARRAELVWKLLDFALLKRSSVSFFDIEKQETAMSKWSRATTRVAKVGKGLLKDEKAQKLALQHWLEAIDPRHRYGHNLHYYYDCWLHCESKQPFFYWLDVREGREINLEKCSRSKLLSQCIKYLGQKEREDYEVVIEDGKFLYKKSRQILDTSCGPRDAKWIFVLSTSKSLYLGQKKKGTFQHSSFLAGGATSAAGRLVVENGTLKAIWPHSGHYRPTEENFEEFKSFRKDNSVDLTDVKMSPAEEDEEFWGSLRRVTSEHEKSEDKAPVPEETDPCQAPEAEEIAAASPEPSEETPGDDQEGAEQAPVPREKILERINSKKGMKSYQLGKQLSFKWTTGAGPRIGCVRDYPSELQLQALEQVNLSPRYSVA